MNLCLVSTVFLFLFFLITFTEGNENPTHFTGDVSINCGSTSTFAARNGKQWVGDDQPKFSSLVQINGLSTSSTVTSKLKADPVPHKTARISQSQFSYAFQLNPGQKIIRLHFNPSRYKGFKGIEDLFTVEADSFTLLSNFSASLTADALGVNSFTKEFCLNIQENELLNITFSPESIRSLETYAFINGIEIISVPGSLSYFHGEDIGLQVVGEKSMVYVDHHTALEMIHRLNIKQNPVPSSGDLDDVFPMWAMQNENKIKDHNTWTIPVDVGFRYLIRLHLSGMGLKIAGTGDVMFKVLINEMIAHTNIDIEKVRDENKIPRYRDYMVMVRGHKKEGKRDLLISVQSYDELVDGHGLLSGFEIFKLSNPDNSLASPYPLPLAQDSPSQMIQTLLLVLGHRNGIATVIITLISLVNIIVHNLREIKDASVTEENKPSAKAERHCRRFSIAEVKSATRNFNDALLIGRGGFGKVYKGLIDRGQKTVAVKRLKSNSKQGTIEFLTEIETLSELRHINLVSLIGYCNEHGEMILVYEYMAGGTLADHLYKLPRDGNNSSSLTWKQCLNICIGAGRGLDYLHTGHGVIHRDVKASNILLDENFVAKVSDFGLAKLEDRNKLQSHVSTNVKGTRGYLDPHYFNTCKITRKSDTYAFGVVLFEVLCGRPAVDSFLPEEERLLPTWARYKIREGEVDQIVASSLREEISPDSLKTFVGVAERCLLNEPKNRPTMSQIVLQLELSLEQHESKQLLVLNEIASASNGISPCDDEIDQSVNTGRATVSSDSKAVDVERPSGRIDVRKAIMNKPPRFWPWDTFWNRVKPSKKNETFLSEISEEIFESDIKLAKFDWGIIAAATNQFSNSKKIGQGRFGTVYKAVLRKRKVVAVKRLSPSFPKEELKNEILLLPNLQHPNIIKLLGYCIHREEKLLVYEFMENTSLDTFIGDEVQHRLLQWAERFKIIMGIARGLVYLHHRDSELRVIHRNLTPTNILLDNEMNPKISNFAVARTLVKHQSELETTGIIGTFGYMALECVMQGKFSVNSDVYGFGIIVLEILSGQRIIIDPNSKMFLLDYAWKLWNEGRVLHLLDESLGGAVSGEEALRCITVGLLCIQEQPHDRPSMPSVVKMLEGDERLVEPQQPWPRVRREDSASSSVHTYGLRSNGTLQKYLEAWRCETNKKFGRFDWDTIAAATNQFSSLNKVGEGGFGSVFKAVLPTGQVAAVKRLSPSSRQGHQEFKNEILLLPNLQHQNIIKLLGYCIHNEEKLLLYEFMVNTSLDTFLKDEAQRRLKLQWTVRWKIMLGIAHGVVYLHQDSGLRVIHRSLKPSNILLDREMNPKISDFDFARTLTADRSESETMRIVGTYGYMSPEYAMQGIFSVKSDVYCFGIILLEIVSGQTVRRSYPEALSLVEYAWELWNEGRPLDLVDVSLEGAFPEEEALRCIQVGLLCTEEKPHNRPTMPCVLQMLEGDELLVEPQQPWPVTREQDSAQSNAQADGQDSDATFEFDDTLER